MTSHSHPAALTFGYPVAEVATTFCLSSGSADAAPLSFHDIDDNDPVVIQQQLLFWPPAPAIASGPGRTYSRSAIQCAPTTRPGQLLDII